MEPVDLECITESNVGDTNDVIANCSKNKKAPREVFMRCVFVKVGDIDTVRECFEASIYLEVEWIDAVADTQWYPDIYVDNAIGDLKQRKLREYYKNKDGNFTFFEKHSFKGKFFERMELWHFPFDTQDITLTICSQLPECEVALHHMKNKPSQVYTSTFTDEQEWSLHVHVDVAPVSVISDNQIAPKKRPGLQFSTRATRRSMFYIINIWFVSFMLCVLAIAVIGIPRKNLQGRLQLSFILMLTTVTFKFVIANHIPRISYLTILDKSVMLNLLFLVLLSIYHAIVSLFPTSEWLDNNEKYLVMGFSGLYLFCNLAILLQVYFGAYQRQVLMNQKDKMHENSLKQAKLSGIANGDNNCSICIAPQADMDELSNV